MEESVSVQWFPGHMAKTRRKIKENLTLVDAVAEIIDARIPQSSRNPEIDALVARRTEAKKAKNWAEADAIRDQLKAMGIEVTDTPQGPVWKRI